MSAPDATLVLAVTLALLGGGVVRGYTGFGASLIYLPVAMSIVGPARAIVILWLVDAVIQIPVVVREWRRADIRPVLILFVGSCLGLPVGLWLVVTLDAVAVRWLISLITGTCAILLIAGYRTAGPPRPATTLLVGVASGMGSGLGGLSGMVVALFWLSGQSPTYAIRASLLAYGALITVTSGVGYWASGLFDRSIVPYVLAGGPAYGIGMWAGVRLFRLYGALAFRPVTYALIIVSSIFGAPVFDRVLGRG